MLSECVCSRWKDWYWNSNSGGQASSFQRKRGNRKRKCKCSLIVENSTNDYISLLAPDASETSILFGKPQSNTSRGIIYNNTSTANGLQFRTNGNGTSMVLTSTGFLGINTIRPVVETHIVHGFGSITHDLQISHVSLGTDHYWNLYTEIGGALELAADENIVGTNDYILIPCTGQKGEGDRIKESLKPVIETGF